MNLVGYLRVSTDKQAEEGLGLDIQRTAIKTWAKVEGHRIIAWCADEGVSGSNGLDSREGLADALALLRQSRAVGLVVYRLDRLARDLVVQESLLAEVRRLRCEMFTTSAAEAGYLNDDPNDPSRTLIRQVLGAVSQYERAMIRMRLLAGQRRKQENGGYHAGGPPFGYRAEGKALVPDADEHPVLMRIEQLRRQGASLREIAATLTNEGHRPKRSDRWHVETLRQIIARLDLAS